MDVIINLATFVLGLVLGYRLAEWVAVQAFKKMMDELGVTEDKLRALAATRGVDLPEPTTTTTDMPELEICIESHQGQLFAYRKDDQQFLGQGTDRATLIDRIRLEFAGDIRLIVREEDGADLIKETT